MYDSLIIGYMDDVGKYAKSRAQILHLRHCIQSSFAQAGKRIKFEGFGNAAYKSREMGESLRTFSHPYQKHTKLHYSLLFHFQ